MDKLIFPMLDPKAIEGVEEIKTFIDENRPGYKDYKIKTIQSGPIVELIIYPVWDTKSKNRCKKKYLSRIAQQKYNEKQAREKCARAINANFITGRHLWLTLTYSAENEPKSYEEAQRNIKNYIGRVKRHCKRNNLPELKAVYTVEYGEDGRVHHHVVLNIEDLTVAEQLWTTQSERAKKRKNPYYTMKLIGRTQVRRLQDDDFGLTGVGCYIGKPAEKNSKTKTKNKKSFFYTRNLEKPTVHEYKYIGGKKLSLKKIKQMAMDNVVFENFLKSIFSESYHVSQAVGKKSEFVNGFYLYGVLKQIISIKKRC